MAIAIVIVNFMSTTIQVSETTRQKLETVKEQEGARTLDEVISKMVDKELKTPKSMFGKAKISSWKKDNRLKLHGE